MPHLVGVQELQPRRHVVHQGGPELLGRRPRAVGPQKVSERPRLHVWHGKRRRPQPVGGKDPDHGQDVSVVEGIEDGRFLLDVPPCVPDRAPWAAERQPAIDPFGDHPGGAVGVGSVGLPPARTPRCAVAVPLTLSVRVFTAVGRGGAGGSSRSGIRGARVRGPPHLADIGEALPNRVPSRGVVGPFHVPPPQHRDRRAVRQHRRVHHVCPERLERRLQRTFHQRMHQVESREPSRVQR
mmetsp:Transcript_23267/g.60901  ORF Transcript_23267/g.60901 Transcript_23267/m.60901 type:complete len:239 (+) Transcript_23267:1160-1876(+)